MVSGKEKEKAAMAAHWDVALAECKAHPPRRHQTGLLPLHSPHSAECRKVMSAEGSVPQKGVAGALATVKHSLKGQLAAQKVSPCVTNESHIQEVKLTV